jgi:hypothetical protein
MPADADRTIKEQGASADRNMNIEKGYQFMHGMAIYIGEIELRDRP